MARTEQTQLTCSLCQRPTLHTRQTPTTNHVLHLLLSLVTLGIWLPIWFLASIESPFASGDPWRCSTCGQATRQDNSRKQVANAIALALFVAFLVVWYFAYQAWTR